MSKALKAAIEANDAEAARKAARGVKDWGRKLPKAEPPLEYACKLGAERVVEALLDAGAPSAGNGGYEGEQPLALAAAHGHAGVVRVLGARGVAAKVVEHALFAAVLEGRKEVVRAILESCKPEVGLRVLEVATWRKDGRIFEMLLQYGADVNMVHSGSQNREQRGETALHDAAGAGYAEPIRLLLERGADVNARDGFGGTPLMHLAASMPRLDHDLRMAAERDARRAAEGKPPLVAVPSGRRYGDRVMGDPLDGVRLLLERRADAAARDRFGNDALDYYSWNRMREREGENEALGSLLRSHGTAGNPAMDGLWTALRADDLAAARAALEKGADPNRDAPPPVSTTPLIMCKSAAMAELLLEHGADANKPSLNSTPLIAAAGSGEMEMVKLLIKAGADIHAIAPRSPKSEYVANAWSAADLNRKHEVAAYLKSLGAGNPVLPDWEPLEAGVVVWENFSEIIVKAAAGVVARALGRMIGGTVQERVYGKEMAVGKKTYAVLQPKGMAWSNVMRVMPPLRMFEEADEEFLQELAREAKASVILVEYSDAADAASVKRFEADGGRTQEQSGDEEMLEEMVGAMGDETPDWAKAKLKKMKKEKRPELDLKKLAAEERFVVAWGGLSADGREAVEVSFTNLPAEAFEGVAWVTNGGVGGV